MRSVTPCKPYFLSYRTNPRTMLFETLANDKLTGNKSLKLTKDTTKLVRDRVMLYNYSIARQENKSNKDCTLKAGSRDLLITNNLSLKDRTGTFQLNPQDFSLFNIL